MIFKILAPFDIFKVPVHFYYDGLTKRSSPLGIFLSIAIFVFMIFQFINSEFIVKSAPIVVTQSIESAHSDRVDFSKSEPLVFGIIDRATNKKIALDPTILNIQILYLNLDHSDITTFVPTVKDFSPCKFENLSIKKEFFEATEMSKLYCLKNPEFYLEGYEDENLFSLLQILVYPCDNQTSNGTCKSVEEIDKFFNDKLFSSSILNSQIDANNYENPFTFNYYAVIAFLDSKLIKTNIFYAKNSVIQTDDGWLFPYKNIKKSTSFDKSSNDFEIRQFHTQPLIKWMFMASKAKTLSTRTYQRLPEALASVASMANLFIIICFLFAEIVSYVSMMKNFMNQFYIFENIRKNKKTKKTKKQKRNKDKEKEKEKEVVLKSKKKKTSLKNESEQNLQEKKDNGKKGNELFQQMGEKKENEMDQIEIEMSNKINNNLTPKILKDDSFILEKESKNLPNQNDKFDLIDLSKKKEVVLKSEQNFQEKKDNGKKGEELFQQMGEKKENEMDQIEIEMSKKINNNFTVKILKEDSFILEKESKNLPNQNDLIDLSKNNNDNNVTNLMKNNIFNEKNNKDFDYSLSLSSYEYIKLLLKKKIFWFLKKSKKEKLILKAERIFKKQMDISHITKKIHEIEQLKIILLDEDQTILFDYLMKPIISINETIHPDSPSKRTIIEDLVIDKKRENFLESLKRCEANQISNSINKKLVEFCSRQELKFNSE